MMRVADRIAVSPARAVAGVLRVPGDKSISHRYALLAAIADGPSTVSNYGNLTGFVHATRIANPTR